MKKIKSTKLVLNAETIRALDPQEMQRAAGGYWTNTCVGCATNTVNPCATGPTQTICLTYVQASCNRSGCC